MPCCVYRIADRLTLICHPAIVVGDYLYIDGGEVTTWDGHNTDSQITAQRKYYPKSERDAIGDTDFYCRERHDIDRSDYVLDQCHRNSKYHYQR